MSRLAASIAAAALLGACATDPFVGTPFHTGPSPAAPYYGAPAGTYQGPEATYVCDDLTTVVVRWGLGTAVATLNSGSVFNLTLQGAGSGFFATRAHAFQVRARDAVWTVAPRPPVLCRIQR